MPATLVGRLTAKLVVVNLVKLHLTKWNKNQAVWFHSNIIVSSTVL